MYSFVYVKKKKLFNENIRLWLIFISIVVLIMLLFSFILLYKAKIYSQDNKYIISKILQEKKQILNLKNKIELIKKEKNLALEIKANNDMINSFIQNIFDLVPDEIFLKKVIIQKDKLYIYGFTPSKEIYNKKFLVSFNHIFNQNKTNFYRNKYGYFFETRFRIKEDR